MTDNDPVAWRVFDTDGSEAVYSLEEQARAAAYEMNWSIEPLYRSPTLTDEEREAIETAAMISAGSHGSPVAWGIQFWDGTLHGAVFQTFEAADKHLTPPHSPLRREDVTAKIVPLFVSPSLTDEEREAVEDAVAELTPGPIADTLRSLLQRLGGTNG
jgi:hypothetical protein